MASTIRDIANKAGVSTAAVSRVLHGSGGTIRVSEEKAAHIRAVAAQMNYVPNAVARNLKQGKSKNVGLVFENFGSISAGPLYYAYLFDGLAEVLFSNHYRLTILPEIDVKNAHKELSNGQLDGLIWCKFVDDPAVEKMIGKLQLPVVALNTLESHLPPRACAISCDNYGGADLVVSHLVELGHKRIAFVNEIREEQTPDAIARYEGYKAAMARHGLEVSDQDLFTWSFEATEFPLWWETNTGHTALFVWNEGQASRILRRAQNAGVNIPGELSVVGFDSTDFCEATTPPLSAVRQPIREMARHAATTLLSMIAGQPPEQTIVTFPVTLDVRGSTQALTQSRVSKS
ncbi:MAG TPA: LacI family DNA-binding transcriptional regulator [Fimbriimonas sp.]|nr:LacI family DNA-binding transcriptional regulator [Fimbriimonas sp.]